MPQEVIISIQRFNGMVTNPHKEDIPDNMSVYAYNIDPQTELGVLRGIEQSGASYTANGSAIPDVYEADWISYEDTGVTKHDLIYIDKDDEDISAIENFYGAEAARTLTDLVTTGIIPRCVKTFNNAAQIGNGVDDISNVVYRLLANKNFFNDLETVTAGLKYDNGQCWNNAGASGGFYPFSVTNTGAPGGYFQDGVYYWYLVSIIIDGLQESNLPPISGGNGILLSGTTSDEISITIQATEGSLTFSAFDKRITAIKLYRAESIDNQVGNLGLFKLIKTIDINTGAGSADWALNGNHYEITITDDGSSEGGATYEEETGMPETLQRQSVRYALNEVGGGYHWATRGQPEGESDVDWNRYIFRSKKFRPNMFDWVRDFLVLPEVPIALAWYAGRLYAFSENTVYRINPELLVVEDTYFGAGASHRQSVFISEYGLYFCNLNGAYLIRDSGIITISDPIAELPRVETYLAYKYLASQTASSNFDRIVIKAEVDKRLILFIGATAAHASLCLGYYIPTGQWYGFGLGAITLAADSGLFGGKDGEIYISNATASYRLFAHATPLYETAAWISKEFHLNEPSQNKSWNMIKWDGTVGTGTILVKYNTEGGNPASGTTATSGVWINIYKKTFQVYLAITGNAVVDSLDIIFRRLFGKR
jgi:hypothetical protein